MSRGFASNYRLVLLSAGLFGCFGALGVRLVWLHVIERDALLRTITKTRRQLIVETARRGDIRDRNGAKLATSYSRIVLGVDPTMVRPQDEKVIPQLAAMIGVPESEVRRLFYTRFAEPSTVLSGEDHGATATARSPHGPRPAKVEPAGGLVFSLNPASRAAATPVVAAPAASVGEVESTPDDKGRAVIQWAKLAEDISEQLYVEIQKLGLKCITADRVYRRAYPNNQLAAHLVGYVNREQAAAAGMEAYADFYLRGQDGWRVGERDGRNRELAQFRTRRVPPVDGFNVTLSIDTVVQDIVEQELAYIAQKFEPLKATIIVSDPRDGFILGMGNYPSFNLNEYNKVPKEEQARMKNIAVADIYEPGSVFKIVAAAAALEERLVFPGTVFDCTLDKIAHRGRMVSLPDEDHRMGHLTVAEIITHSSNKGAAQLGVMLGDDRLYRYARAFGFGEKMGFPVGGEVSGLLNPTRQWVPIDITRIAMGHSISSTVLQMHQAMTVLASGGVLLRPQIIREIRDGAPQRDRTAPDGFRYDREVIRSVVSAETAARVAAMLTGVARKGGTAPEAAIEGYDVAGKTGTTQKFIDGQWSKKHHIASFVGFFPAHHPQVAISVVVDDADHRAPGGIAYGRNVAAPSFKRIGERLIPILDIKTTSHPARPSLMAAHEGGRR